MPPSGDRAVNIRWLLPILVFLTTLLSWQLQAQPQVSNNAPKKTLTVYTYSSFVSAWGPGPIIKKRFERQCDCTLNFVALDDGVSILNRLKLEKKRTKADVVIGLDDNLLSAAKATGLFAPHQVNLSHVAVPQAWHDSVFVPYDYGYFAFVYNKEKLKNPPQSFEQLLDKNNKLSIIYQDPRTSTPGLGLLLWVKKLYGDKAPQAWQRLASKTVTVTKGWSEAYAMFLNGEADMVLSYTTSPAYHQMMEKDNKYSAAIFKEGHYKQVELAAKIAHSPHPKLADEFMAFIISDDFQSAIPTSQWMYPATDIALPAEFAQLAKPDKSLSFSADEIHQKRRAWVRQWQQALISAN